MAAKTCKREGCAGAIVARGGPYALLCAEHREELRAANLHKRLPQSKRDAFVTLLREANTPEVAAREVGVPLRTLYWHRAQDEDFKVAWVEAFDASADLFEQRLFDIALGRKAEASRGQVLALFGALKARRPKVWMEKFQQIAAAGESDKPEPVSLDLSKLSVDELERLHELTRKARHDGEEPGERHLRAV